MRRSGVRVTGVASARARIREVSQRAANPAPGLAQVPPILERHVDETFASRGATVGWRWKPLSKRYGARKMLTSTRGPLILSGGLRESFSGGRWHIDVKTMNSLRWGTRHPLAHLHQRGSKGRRVPARPFVVVTPELKREVRDELSDYVTGTGQPSA